MSKASDAFEYDIVSMVAKHIGEKFTYGITWLAC